MEPGEHSMADYTGGEARLDEGRFPSETGPGAQHALVGAQLAAYELFLVVTMSPDFKDATLDIRNDIRMRRGLFDTVEVSFLWFAIHRQICEFNRELMQGATSHTFGENSLATSADCAKLLKSYLAATNIKVERQHAFLTREKKLVSYGSAAVKDAARTRPSKRERDSKKASKAAGSGAASTARAPAATALSTGAEKDSLAKRARTTAPANGPAVAGKSVSLGGWCIFHLAEVSGMKNKRGDKFRCYDGEQCGKGKHGEVSTADAILLAIVPRQRLMIPTPYQNPRCWRWPPACAP
jgi:hypothetical protein